MAKKLIRPLEGRMLAGICAGLADHLDLDVSLVRLLFVAITLITAVFPMAFFYFIAWIIIPSEEQVVVVKKTASRKKS
jgi:phage shock protein C